MRGLLDSGASRTIVGRSGIAILEHLKLPVNREVNVSCTTADGETCQVVGSIQAPIRLQDRVVVLNILLVPSFPHVLILGVDFWSRMGIVPDLRNKAWQFSSIAVDEVVTSRDFYVSEEQRKRLTQLIDRHFASQHSALGCTNSVEHRIIVEDTPPIKQRNYPVSPKLQEVIDQELDSMLEQGVVEPSNSAWSSPVVLIRKKNGTYRFCVDYRKLNKVTKKDAYPLPLISSILDNLGHARFLSSLDIKSAYWQVPIAADSREFTAFSVSGRGLFHFRRMPFGLTNAPATFQRLIDNIIGHDLEPYVFQYLDDLIISTPTFDEHLRILNTVLDRLSSSGLTLSREKCQFCLPSLRYLGYLIDGAGLHVDPDKVSAIMSIPTPTSVKQVRQFLGMASWYRRFLPNFSTLVAPLTHLLKKSSKFVWTSECADSFASTKEKLVTSPVLYCPDFTKTFVVQTDASDYGIGAVLTQEYPDGEHVISYISRSLNAAERNYSTTQKECLAVIWAIEKFRGYLEGYKFRVITDHHSLIWLQTLQNPTGKLCRWALRLQAFDFDIIHRRGSSNVVPDALSRSVPVVDSINALEARPDGVVHVEQPVDDPWYTRMLRDVRENPLRFSKWRLEGYQLFKLVHGETPVEDSLFRWRRVVPKGLRSEVLRSNHDEPLGGHLGVYKTYKRISTLYYWPQMRSDVARYVRGCTVCQQSKPEQLAPKGFLGRNPVADRPWKIISTDLVGPLPRSSKGHSYILVVTDSFSKFARFFPLRKATAKAVIHILENEIVLLFGAPQLILADNGTQFTAREFSKFLGQYGISRRLNPVYHPQANPTERTNRTLKSMLTSFASQDHRKWDVHLSKLACALRTSTHQVTGFTPYMLTFGREYVRSGNLYGELRKTAPIEFARPPAAPHPLDDVYRLVQERLDKSFQASARRYNLRRRQVDFSPGDFVWRRNYALSNAVRGISASLAPKYVGPFKIAQKIGYHTYTLEGDDNSGRRHWHVKDLKEYVDRDSPGSNRP